VKATPRRIDALQCEGGKDTYGKAEDGILYSNVTQVGPSRWAIACPAGWHYRNKRFCCGPEGKAQDIITFADLDQPECQYKDKIYDADSLTGISFKTTDVMEYMPSVNTLQTGGHEYVFCSKAWEFDAKDYTCPGKAMGFGVELTPPKG